MVGQWFPAAWVKELVRTLLPLPRTFCSLKLQKLASWDQIDAAEIGHFFWLLMFWHVFEFWCVNQMKLLFWNGRSNMVVVTLEFFNVPLWLVCYILSLIVLVSLIILWWHFCHILIAWLILSYLSFTVCQLIVLSTYFGQEGPFIFE